MTLFAAPLRIVHLGFQGFDLAASCAGLPGLDLVAAADEAEVVEHVAGCDALFLNAPRYSEAIASAARAPGSRVRWIQFTSSGTETALRWGVPAGCTISNASSAWAPTVAEHGVALILALIRQIPLLERERALGRWNRPPLLRALTSLEGARVGLLGYGAIAQAMAVRLKPFGAEIIGFSRGGQKRAGADAMHPATALGAIAGGLDVLCSLIPLSPQTRHIIDGAVLDRLPPHAFVVNLGRGGTLDQAALAARLADGRLAGAALDVFDPEPLPADAPLWALPNLIVSPHLAAFGGTAGWLRLEELCRANIRRYQNGEPLRDTVILPA